VFLSKVLSPNCSIPKEHVTSKIFFSHEQNLEICAKKKACLVFLLSVYIHCGLQAIVMYQ